MKSGDYDLQALADSYVPEPPKSTPGPQYSDPAVAEKFYAKHPEISRHPQPGHWCSPDWAGPPDISREEADALILADWRETQARLRDAPKANMDAPCDELILFLSLAQYEAGAVKAYKDFLTTGLMIFDSRIDAEATAVAGKPVIHFQLHEPLRRYVTAFWARQGVDA